ARVCSLVDRYLVRRNSHEIAKRVPPTRTARPPVCAVLPRRDHCGVRGHRYRRRLRQGQRGRGNQQDRDTVGAGSGRGDTPLQHRGHHESEARELRGDLLADRQGRGGTGPPHVALGMIEPFTASSTADVAAPGSASTMYSVSVKNFTFQGMPETVPANQPFEVTFINYEAFPIIHEFVVLKLPACDTAQSVVNDAKKKGPKAEDDWAHFADSGAPLPIGSSAVVHMNLPPGNYVAT